jgi:hypothetical protein
MARNTALFRERWIFGPLLQIDMPRQASNGGDFFA